MIISFVYLLQLFFDVQNRSILTKLIELGREVCFSLRALIQIMGVLQLSYNIRNLSRGMWLLYVHNTDHDAEIFHWGKAAHKPNLGM